VDEETFDLIKKINEVIQKIEKKIRDLETNLLVQDSKAIESLKPEFEHPVTGKEKPMTKQEFNKKIIERDNESH